MNATMWVNEASSQVLFQSQWTVSDWHGRWTHDLDSEQITILFNYAGGEDNLKSSLLFMEKEGRYWGYDYMQEFLERRRQCLTCRRWHKLPSELVGS